MDHLTILPETITFDGENGYKKGTNKRATIRYRCPPATLSRIMTAEDQEFQRAWVQNLSLHGIGLLMSRPLAVGTLIAIQIKNSALNKNFEFTASVAHSTLQAGGDWLVGCALFQPLSEDDLEVLLQ